MRRLLPRPEGPQGLGQPGQPPKPKPLPERSRSRAALACDPCRKQRTKCSGGKPRCALCISRNLDCYYPPSHKVELLRKRTLDLEGQVSTFRELFGILASASELDANAIVNHIKSGADPEQVVRRVREGDLLLQLALEPETRFRYVFPYISTMPENLLADNPYTSSFIYEVTKLYSSAAEATGGGQPAPLQTELDAFRNPRFKDLAIAQYQSLYLKPIHAAKIVDPRLDAVKPSQWTTVSTDDALMRDILGVYFLHEYPYLALFHKDYFLEDMAANRHYFCSSLLVNCLLACACHCDRRFQNRSEYWNPENLVYKFLAEARRLWDLEEDAEPKLTTLQAAVMFNLIYNMFELDQIGRKFGRKVVPMIKELRLFDNSIQVGSERERNGRAFSAWTIFNWKTMMDFHFMSVSPFKGPPDANLPDPSANLQWYGEVWIRYPLDRAPSPTSFGYYFEAMSRLRVIHHQISEEFFKEGSQIQISRANELYSQLKTWYNNLRGPLHPLAIVLPSHFALHMDYQQLLIALYRPFIDDAQNDPSPLKIIESANRHLQTLIRVWYLRHGFDTIFVYLALPLVIVAFTCLGTINEKLPPSDLEVIRSTLFLVMKGLRDQSSNYFLAGSSYHLIQSKMRTDESEILARIAEAPDKDGNKEAQRQNIKSQWLGSRWSEMNGVAAGAQATV